MEQKICPECGTENEEKYTYCKNCGTFLGETKPHKQATATEFIDHSGEQNSDPGASPRGNAYHTEGEPYDNSRQTPPPYGVPPLYTAYDGYAIDGVPAEDIRLFVGQKAGNIMPKFMKMEFAHSKTSWCWPAAILGYLFGPVGAALWFLYRKMYKIGVLLLAVGAALMLVTSALTYGTSDVTIDSILDAVTDGDIGELYDLLEQNGSAASVAASGIDFLARVTVCILTGLYGFNAYKNHCVDSIIRYRQSISDQRYYKFGLASVGGTSGVGVALGIFAVLILQYAISLGIMTLRMLLG